MTQFDLRLACLLAALLCAGSSAFPRESDDHSPALIFTPQRIKRLKRERERQTRRWTNFEERLRNVADSSERGFELALYKAVTGEDLRPGELERWLSAHPCEPRQVSLVRAVQGRSDAATRSPAHACPPAHAGPIARMRDLLFENPETPVDDARFLSALRGTPLTDADEIYAAAEYLVVARQSGADPRQADTSFFNSLPVQFLLSLAPQQVEHPDWKTHVAALALIGLDPNSDSSQFLQGWAIEDRQMLHDGPGLAYELLWADPYLPGVGYQNLDPWWYDEGSARLLARSDWTPQACAIQVAPGGIKETGCPSGWQSQPARFGRLELIPMTSNCLQLAARPTNQTALLWKLTPESHIKFVEDHRSEVVPVDRSGLWRVPANLTGKVCTVH